MTDSNIQATHDLWSDLTQGGALDSSVKDAEKYIRDLQETLRERYAVDDVGSREAFSALERTVLHRVKERVVLRSPALARARFGMS